MAEDERLADMNSIQFIWDLPDRGEKQAEKRKKDNEMIQVTSPQISDSPAMRSKHSTSSHNPFVMDGDDDDTELYINSSTFDPFGSLHSQVFVDGELEEDENEETQVQSKNVFTVVYDDRKGEELGTSMEKKNIFQPKQSPPPVAYAPNMTDASKRPSNHDDSVEKPRYRIFKSKNTATVKEQKNERIQVGRSAFKQLTKTRHTNTDSNDSKVNITTQTSMANDPFVLTLEKTSTKPFGSRYNTGMPKVFGKNYKYIKSHMNQVQITSNETNLNKWEDKIDNISKNNATNSYEGKRFYISNEKNKTHGQTFPKEDTGITQEQREDEYYKRFTKLQQELKSSSRKIYKLKQINELALERKDELQREALCAYKRISDLEISENASTTKHRELSVEIRIAKQRIAEAEREALHAIGRTSKLEQDLKDAASKRQRYYEELIAAEEKVNNLERNARDMKTEIRTSKECSSELQHHLTKKENEIIVYEEKNKALMEIIEKKDKERDETLTQFDIVLKEKSKWQGQIEELTKANKCLKADLQCLHAKYETSQRTVEQCTTRIKEQKEKFETMIASRLGIEKELRTVHDELSKERVEKQTYTAQCDDLLEKLSESKVSINQYKKDSEFLQNENRNMKDRVLYLELYKQMMASQAQNNVTTNQANKRRSNEVYSRGYDTDSVRSTASNQSVSRARQKNGNMENVNDIERITRKIKKIQQDHQAINKQAHIFSTNEASLSLYSDAQTKTEDTSQLSSKNEIDSDIFSLDEQESASRSFPAERDRDLLYEVEMKHDGSTIEFMKNLRKPTIFPSFAAGFQQSMGEQDKEATNFSDLLNNKDIANALL